MTIDWDSLAKYSGYDDMRQYICLCYYIPKPPPSLQQIADDLGVSKAALLEYMGRENLPRRGKGQPPRCGFYCEECLFLTPLRLMRHNLEQTKYICEKCLQKQQKEVRKRATLDRARETETN